MCDRQTDGQTDALRRRCVNIDCCFLCYHSSLTVDRARVKLLLSSVVYAYVVAEWVHSSRPDQTRGRPKVLRHGVMWCRQCAALCSVVSSRLLPVSVAVSRLIASGRCSVVDWEGIWPHHWPVCSLIPGKISKIGATICQILRLKCIKWSKFAFCWAPDPVGGAYIGGAYSAPLDHVAVIKRACF